MDFRELKEQMLKDPKFRKAYNRPDPIYWLKRKWTDFKIWWRSNNA